MLLETTLCSSASSSVRNSRVETGSLAALRCRKKSMSIEAETEKLLRGAHHHDIGAVALGQVAFREHLIAERSTGGIAVIRIGPIVPDPVDRDRSHGAIAGRRIGQPNLKGVRRLVHQRGKFLPRLRTFGGRRRKEMRITALWRDVEPAYRTGCGGSRRIGVEAKARARPAR